MWIALCGNVDQHDFQTYTEFFDSHLEKRNLESSSTEVFCVYFDLRHLKWAPVGLVYSMGEYMKKSEKLAKLRINSSVILVTPHPLLKGLLSLLFSIKRPANPNLITSDLQEGWNFLDQEWRRKFD